MIATFAIIWLPFILHPADEDYIKVLRRLVPLERGVFEDYVANFWCSTKPLLRWKGAFEQQAMVLICLSTTVMSVLPSMMHQICNPSHKGLLYSMANSALGFFLFSYQVKQHKICFPSVKEYFSPSALVTFDWNPNLSYSGCIVNAVCNDSVFTKSLNISMFHCRLTKSQFCMLFSPSQC